MVQSPSVHTHLLSMSWTNIGGGNSFDMHLDDLDYDGDVDVIYEELAMDLFKWLENDAASFTEHDVTTEADGPNVLASGDLNNDGLVDIAYTSNNGLQLAFNNGSGEFTLVDIEGEQSNGKLVGLADMDKDGDIDLVCQGTSSRCFWYENDGSGNMTQHLLGSSVSSLSYIDPVDLDDDGDMDVVISSNFNDEYYWFENNGSQTSLETLTFQQCRWCSPDQSRGFRWRWRHGYSDHL